MQSTFNYVKREYWEGEIESNIHIPVTEDLHEIFCQTKESYLKFFQEADNSDPRTAN